MFFQFDIYNILSTLLISFTIQMFFFIFAISFKTDKVTDFSYSLSFILITLLLTLLNKAYTPGHILLTIFIIIWGLRLGSYLFLRILKIGKDDRFDDKRNNVLSFLGFWILQAATVWIVLIPAAVYFSLDKEPGFTPLYCIGVSLWVIGFIIEVVSDAQKYSFKNNRENRGKWTQSGLWKISRHPNYFGETILWWGLFILIISHLSTSFWWTIIGPVFITFLLLFVSGVPLLEESAERKYGKNPEYQTYKSKTSLFIPWLVKK
ncbi:MAG: DUF1295 domain-containing protein [Spirochaeta sp.]|nr:DUF1295 domain-containing protein [Spirochaeta sp.]